MGAHKGNRLPEIPQPPGNDADRGAALAWLLALDQLAGAGDQRAAEALKESRRTRPDLWDRLVGVGEQAEFAWLELLAPDTVENTMSRQMLEHSVEQTKRRLIDDSRDPVDLLLVNRVIASWLHATYADMVLTQQKRGGGSLKVLEYYAVQAEREHKSHLRAIEALAKVQRLRRPQLAVSVGTLNVAAVGAPAAAVALPEGDALDLGAIEAAAALVTQ